MKKAVLLVLTFVLMLGTITMLGLSAGAEEATLITLPEFECPSRPYATKAELNIPIDEIISLFPKEVEIKYENGKAMFKDFGAARVESAYTWPFSQMELVDGFWTYDVAEEEYEDFVSQINVYGKDDLWELIYFNGEADPWLNIYFGSDCVAISLYSKTVDVWYNVDGMQYRDTYTNEHLECHSSVVYLNDGNELQVEYDFSGKVIYMRMLFSEGIWYYYEPDTGWTSDSSPNETVELPEPYSNYTLGQFMELAPALDLCEHEWVDATCQMPKNCEKCGLWDGEVSDHDYADATCETPKTCITCGETEGEALGHSWKDATTEAPKTCESCGATEGEPLPKPEPEVDPTPDDEAEEPNWFMKLIKAIIDFFMNLFGIEKRK